MDLLMVALALAALPFAAVAFAAIGLGRRFFDPSRRPSHRPSHTEVPVEPEHPALGPPAPEAEQTKVSTT